MRVASLRLRFLAGLINVAAGIGVWGTATGLWIAGAAAYARLRSGAGDQEPDVNAEPPDFHPRLRKLFESRQMQGASTSLAIAGRNLRGLGYRTVGLRRVDARTGGPVSVRSAVIGQLFDQARQATTRSLFQSRVRRHSDCMSTLAPQLRALQQEHAGDPQAYHRAVTALYEANYVNPLAGCLLPLAGVALSHAALALGIRKGRTVRDRVTRTSVIVDR